MSSSSKPQTLAILALVVVFLYVLISVVLYVCLEAVHEERAQPDDAFLPPMKKKKKNQHADSADTDGRPQHFNLRPLSSERIDSPLARNKEQKVESRGDGWLKLLSSSSSTSVRSRFETQFPPTDMVRVRATIDALRIQQPHTKPNMPYNVYQCPDTPPTGYPMTWLLSSHILKDWNPKDTEIPTEIYQGLCVFDWDRDKVKAETYREADVPFVIQNNPEVLRASERWNHPGYLREMIGPEPQHTEYSKSAHLMYWKDRGKNHPPGWKPPSKNIVTTFDEWLILAEEMEHHKNDQLHRDHYYFRLNGSYKGSNSYLYDELPIFRAGDDPSFYMIDPSAARGINCRFGMRGNIAETHYDSSLNWIIVMGGQRRYILAHPDQCKNMELYHFGHPSARHSSIDWTNPPQNSTRPFSKALASEVVLQPGNARYWS